MKVLITGGLGFIGSHTADALLKRGDSVRILDNLTAPVHRDGRPDYVPPGAEVIVGDVRNKADWEKAMDGGVDAVVHLAAYQDYLSDFSKFFHVNTVGTAFLYEVAVEKKIPLKKVVVASSQAAYGEGRYLTADGRTVYPDIRTRAQLEAGRWDLEFEGERLKVPQTTDESHINPQNQYAVSKYTQELVSLSLGKRYDVPTTCMRYSIVQGPRQSLYNAYSGACRIFSLSYLFGKQPVIYEDGNQIRDFVNIQDVVAANLLALDDPRSNYLPLNVGGGRAYTVLEFAEIAAGVFGASFDPHVSGQFRFGDTRHIHSDISRLRSLGWQPRRTAAESVADYREWLLKQQAEEEILNSAYRTMQKTNVVGQARPGAHP
jgi:dTDP-L-rhamnose 4-epimerase